MMEWFKRWLRAFLGIDQLSTLANLTSYIAMLEQRNKDLVTLVGTSHQEMMAALEQLRLSLDQSHPERAFHPPVLDWDTVQAMALYDLEHSKE
jgi:hypothetical protein